MKMSVFEKVNRLKELLAESSLAGISDNEFMASCQRLANRWQYKTKLVDKRKVKLSEIDADVLDFLLRNKYKPTTVYKWFLLVNSRPEIQDLIKKGEVSIKKAFKIKKETKPILCAKEEDLRNDLYELIERYIQK